MYKLSHLFLEYKRDSLLNLFSFSFSQFLGLIIATTLEKHIKKQLM